jgi:hypothetical protein
VAPTLRLEDELVRLEIVVRDENGLLSAKKRKTPKPYRKGDRVLLFEEGFGNLNATGMGFEMSGRPNRLLKGSAVRLDSSDLPNATRTSTSLTKGTHKLQVHTYVIQRYKR